MVASDSDEQLSARLDCALRAGLESDQVDVDRLLSGSQTRARQLRTQRIGVVIAAAVLVVALPVGWEVGRPKLGAEAGPSAMMVHSPHPSVHPAPSPVSRADEVGGGEPSGAQLVALAQDVLPAGLTLRSARYLSAPTGAIVGGLVCPPVKATQGGAPAQASQWVWGPAKTPSTGLTVTVSYTAWPDGPAANAFVAQTHGGGGCRWSVAQAPVPIEEPLAGEAWAASSSSDGVNAGRVALRVGDDIVGVEVQGGSQDAALALARRVAQAEAAQLAANHPSIGS